MHEVSLLLFRANRSAEYRTILRGTTAIPLSSVAIPSQSQAQGSNSHLSSFSFAALPPLSLPLFQAMASFVGPSFTSLVSVPARRPCTSRWICVPRCSLLEASIKPAEIPEGSRLESPSHESDLSRSLSNLRFGYESESISSSPQLIPHCKLRYRCAQGHIVCAKRGSFACRFCPTCCHQMADPSVSRRGRRLSLCEVQAVAFLRGGTLVSTEYKDARTPLVWKCGQGHLWKARLTNVRNGGSWCPECARLNKKLTMKDMHQLARDKDGVCLSTEYISEYVKMKWRCKEGHEFLLEPNNMRRKPNGARKSSWCKLCQKKKASLERKEKTRVKAGKQAMTTVGSQL